MNLRSIAPVALAGLFAVAAIALWFMAGQPIAPATVALATPAPEEAPTPEQPVAVAMPAPEPPPDLPPPKPRIVHSPEALKEMDDIQFMLRDFRTRIGGNPGGTNAEIMKEVMGNNRFNARLGPPEGQRLNEQGELVDRWGSPYFFHQLSMTEMEVRSFGPDRAMYTADDIIVK